MKAFGCLLLGVMLVALLIGLMDAGTTNASPVMQICGVPEEYSNIQEAVDEIGCDLVNVASGTFTETVTVSRTVTIQGQGSTGTVVNGGASGPVFTIRSSGVVTISRLTIANGWANYGGGIFVQLNPPDQRIVQIIESTIRGNTAIQGGGIFSGMGGRVGSFTHAEIHLIRSTVNGNSATENGGGILNVGYSKLYVHNSTLSGNRASGLGGGIHNRSGYFEITSSTLSGNEANSGGGIYNTANDFPYSGYGGSKVVNSIIADSPSGGDCVVVDTTLNDNGHNIIEDGSCITALTSSSGDPMLGPLQDNGGSTLTHALLPGSSAIDGGDNTMCSDIDQRRYPRPIDGDDDETVICDIGSYELINFTDSMYLPVLLK